jgi:hypothetical protein
MITKILVARTIGNNNGVHIKAFRSDEVLIGVSYNPRQKHGYFVNSKPVKPSHAGNKYFNDFAALITMGAEMLAKR